MNSLRSPDSMVLALPLALQLRSAADRTRIGEGLSISAKHQSGSAHAFTLVSTPSGHWVAHQLPGTKAEIAQDPTRWLAGAKPYDFSVSDTPRRFLPLRFSAPIPRRAALTWPGWAGVDRARIAPLLPPGSGPSYIPDFLPLFPTTAAAGSSASARVFAQLDVREMGGATRPAAWALMTVSVGGAVVGLGLSDARGAIMANFAYPPMPAPTPAEAAAGRDAVSWTVDIAIYSNDLGDPSNPDTPPPDFADIIAQLALAPRVAMASIQGVQPSLGPQTLTLGQPLILRSRTSPTVFASSLFLKPV